MKRVVLRVFLGLGLILIMAGAGGYILLRNSPAWDGLMLFSEGTRVENFRNLDALFPSDPVRRGTTVWALGEAPHSLPDGYGFEGENRDLAAFLDRTETTGLLVLHQGRIAHEDYRLGADETSLFTSWSVAKSMLSALIGIALEEGYITSIDDPVADYVSALDGSAYGAVPIRHVLTMSSGIGFDENYDNPLSDVYRIFMSFSTGTPLAEVLAGYEAEREPGIYNNYISSDSLVLGLVLESATGIGLAEYAQTRLWAPMGAEADATWSHSVSGETIAMCCFNATLRDYGRFGQLYLQNGARDDVQIVPQDWIEASITPEAPHLQPGDNPASFWSFGYGYHWWIPEDPQGDYLAIGIWGQYIYIDPSREIVIVKKSADAGFDTRDHETVAAFRAIARHVAGG